MSYSFFSRRNFLLSISAWLGCQARAAAQTQSSHGTFIEPLSHTSGQNTPYAILSNMGPHGYPDKAISLQIEENQTFMIWSPPNSLSGRLVVFSHAEFEIPDDYTPLFRHWASHGFVVVAPVHDDSIIKNGLLSHFGGGAHDEKWDPGIVYKQKQFWENRPKICSSVLDNIVKIERTGKIQILDERPIMAGANLGAFTSQLILGAQPVIDGSLINMSDERFYAGMLLSPQGVGVLGLNDESWRAVTRPILVATGNGDNDATGQDPNTKIDPFTMSPAGNKHLAWFGHLNHGLWTGEAARPETIWDVIFHDFLAVSTAFLIAYGNYNADIFSLLSGNYFDTASQNRLIMKYR